ncbi:MAG TPA: DUF4159 domain-containing protein [Longimicrobiales bacterium]|jgi:hypothetical protein
MRPLVSSRIVLAAVALVGAALAGSPTHPEGWSVTLPRVDSDGLLAAPRAGDGPSVFAPTDRFMSLAASGALAQEIRSQRPEPHEYYFTRGIYSDRRGGGLASWGRRGSWAVDYPKADYQFMVVIKRLVGLDAFDGPNAVELADPALRRYPFLYMLEVGGMALNQAEIHGLRSYLDAGGFLVIDDFWGSWEWENFEYNIRRVLPGRQIVRLDLDHDLFKTFYDITEIKQVPGVRRGRSGGPTWENDGYTPYVLGIHDDQGRLMVVINWNTDLGDAWEWAEDPYYPLEYSTFAYEMGANMIVYGMSH